MVDIESLGSKPPAVILSIGAVEFGMNGLGKEFHYRVDVATSLLHGFTVDPRTVAWWQEQSALAKDAAFHWPGAETIEQVLYRFTKFVDKDTRLWAKGPDYDCVMIAAAYHALGEKEPWSFRNTRDVRTILSLSGVLQRKSIHDHNALNDARVQADAVIESYEKLGMVLE